MKEHPSQGFTHYWFPTLGATNSDVFRYIFAFSDLQSTFLWRRPQKEVENLVLTFLDVLNPIS